MTKRELIKKLDEIRVEIDDLVSGLKGLMDDAKSIYSKIESLPSEEDEIEDNDTEK